MPIRGWFCNILALLAFLSALEKVALSAQPEASPKVLIKEIKVTGAEAIEAAELEPIVAPFIGKEMDLAELRKVAELITDEYRGRGYTLARAIVPEQEIKEGVIEITVLEGRIGEITVEENKYYSTRFIKGNFARVIDDKAVKQRSLEKTLVLLNEYPDLKASAVLKAGKEPGSTDILVKVEDKFPIHIGIDYNNFGTKQVSRHLFGAELELGNFPISGGLFSVRRVGGFDPEITNFRHVAYTFPINNYGTKFGGFYSAGDFDVGRELADLDIEGESLSYGFSFTHPFVRTRFHKITGELGFDLRDTKLFLLRAKGSHDRIRVVKTGALYDGTDGTGRNLISFYIYQGLGSFLGGMKNNDTEFSSRVGGNNARSSNDRAADGLFTKFSLNLARFQRISDSFALLLRGTGHYSTAPLVVSEEFAIGGPDSVRGYPNREFSGDDGYNVSGELRVSPLPNKEIAQLVFFIDHGAARIKNPPLGARAYNDLTGAGPGLRLNLAYLIRFNFRFDVGFPIKPSKASTKDEPTYYLQAVARW